MADAGKTIVLKFGGSAFQPEALKPFSERVRAYVSAGHRVVVVHGGGKEITNLLEALGMKSVFIEGLRVTDEPTLDVVEMVLCGHVNKAIVRSLLASGVPAAGISGQDGALLVARPLVVERGDTSGQRVRIDYGRVGEVEHVNPNLVDVLLRNGIVPVVAPLGVTTRSEALNLNADPAAAALAGALKADVFMLLTDVPGVLVPSDGTQELRSLLTAEDIDVLKQNGVIKGGMIPKVDCCLAALRGGAKASLIASLESFTSEDEMRCTRIVEAAP